jgi:hypothetical protein
MDHLGGCLCGAVRYAATGPLREVVFCHCSQCRKQTGLYYAVTSMPVAALTLHPTDSLLWYAASDFAQRGFCKTCGSALFWQRNGAEEIFVLAGSFDDPTALTPGSHICTEGRAGFYAIADGLPQHAHDAPGLSIAQA